MDCLHLGEDDVVALQRLCGDMWTKLALATCARQVMHAVVLRHVVWVLEGGLRRRSWRAWR